VSCGSGKKKRREILTFEMTSFDIGYNCILGRHFLLKFMAVILTAYSTIKMPGPKGVIILKSDQHDALACENTTLTHAGRFSEKEAQELTAKVAKRYGGSTPVKIAAQTTNRRYTLATSREEEHVHGLYIKPAHHRSASD
jgi:hypothetical protein